MTRRPRLLDLFCGAGGAAMGYHRAGFDVYGVDHRPQIAYPFEFLQADAIEVLCWLAHTDELDEYDAIHASPPCQAHSTAANHARRADRPPALFDTGDCYPDLVDETRSHLAVSGLPYVIENVPRAPLVDPIRLCGTTFGLPLRRHRLFECSFPVAAPPCRHQDFAERRYWNGDRSARNADGTRAYTGQHRLSTVVQVYGNGGDTHEWGPAMGIDWMTPAELAQAIPPAYTEHIGAAMLDHIARHRTEPR